MQPFLIALMILNALLTGCDTRTDQSKKPVGATSQAESSAKKIGSNECDFAPYKPARQSHFVQRTVKTKVQPIYPPEAVLRGIQGWVYVKILVNLDGNVERVCASGPDEALKRASETAVLEWKFKPYFGAANPADAGALKYVEDSIPFHFVLDKVERTNPKEAMTIRP